MNADPTALAAAALHCPPTDSDLLRLLSAQIDSAAVRSPEAARLIRERGCVPRALAARVCGISDLTLSRWEAGVSTPTRADLPVWALLVAVCRRRWEALEAEARKVAP